MYRAFKFPFLPFILLPYRYLLSSSFSTLTFPLHNHFLMPLPPAPLRTSTSPSSSLPLLPIPSPLFLGHLLCEFSGLCLQTRFLHILLTLPLHRHLSIFARYAFNDLTTWKPHLYHNPHYHPLQRHHGAHPNVCPFCTHLQLSYACPQ